ncbi:MAG TPA: hypothetical protein VFR81_08025 [Longimicrobium sp.]|nr:hypothetical protein [Longimicrobium sp.]
MTDTREAMGHRFLRHALGTRLAAAARMHWTHGERVDRSTGPLELRFDDGPTLVLSTGAHGEWMRVDPNPWIDSLAGGASDEDRAFAAEYGKMSRIDVSALPGYADAVGRALDAVRWIESASGSIGGVELAFGPARLTFVSWGDDDHVFTGGADAVPAEWGFRVLSAEPSTVTEAP